MSKLASACFALLIFLGFESSLSARTFTLDKMPEDLDAVDIYLHTLQIGNQVYNNFGHTAIRVHDRKSGQDLVFNWGIFDFGEPISFSWKFYRGILIYKLGIYPYTWAYESYHDEHRTVWEDRFDFDAGQKQRFLEKLIWNSREENRNYAYQYFFDNCSTRPRDYIDEAVDHQLRRQTEQVLGTETFRDAMYNGYQYNPGMDVLLDVGMNSRLDRRMSQWEHMFHPLALRELLLKTPIDGKPILVPGSVVFEAPLPTAYRDRAYQFFLVFCGLGLLGAGALLWVHNPRNGSAGARYRVWSLVGLPLLAVGGFFGFAMPLNWLVSEHYDLHHNANIFLFWPLDWGLCLASAVIFKRGGPIRLSLTAFRRVRWYLAGHFLVTMLLPMLYVLGVIHQEVGRVVVYLLPPYVLALGLLYRFGFRSVEARR